MNELAGLQALARSLAHGDSDADDLIQDTAVTAISRPPDAERPVKPWLVTVLLNRWRMDRRGRTRRQAREQAIELAPAAAEAPPDAIDRARMLEKLASALVELDEPYRKVVIGRYLDGKTAAQLARELGIPAATVRWRLKTGLDRLRSALDARSPRWRVLIPVMQGAVVVKAKTATLSILILLLLIGAGVFGYSRFRSQPEPEEVAASTSTRGSALLPKVSGQPAGQGEPAIVVDDPLPGQGRVVVDPIAEGGAIGGRVINWSTGEGVSGAELTFLSPAGAVSVRSKDKGVFELGAEQPGAYSLTTIVASGFLPYAPELSHSPVRIMLLKKQAVRGITLFVFPALDYRGVVVDAQGAPVAGAKVKLADPAGEQTLIKLATEWTTDSKGQFTFNAPDFGVFEASKGKQRGWSILDGNAMTTHEMKIVIGDAPARDSTIKGKTVDTAGQPIAGVLVTAVPAVAKGDETPRATVFATSEADGSFTLDELDRIPYTLIAEVDDHATARKEKVPAGTQNLMLAIDRGLQLAGSVHDPDDKPIAAFTLLVTRREGLIRELVHTRTVIDPTGKFSVRVPKGDYELLVSSSGWAPSAPVKASAGATDVAIELSRGATLAGRVFDAKTREPIPYARVQREGGGGGASALPVNAGTVTRTDGTFELTGIPPGPFTISIGAGNHHPKLEAGLVAADGGSLGPLEIPLAPLAEGEQPKIELVGIGVKLSVDGEALLVELVVPASGAEAAGIVAGDHIVAIDGIPVTTTGMDGAVSRIRGVAGTKLSVTVLRDGKQTQLVVERKPLRF